MLRLTLIGIFCCFFSGPVHGCKGKGPRTPAPNPGSSILDKLWVVISYKLTETGHIFEHFLWSNFKLFKGVFFARNYQDYQHNQRHNCVNGSHPCQDHHDCDDCVIGGVECYTETVQDGVLINGNYDWIVVQFDWMREDWLENTFQNDGPVYVSLTTWLGLTWEESVSPQVKIGWP